MDDSSTSSNAKWIPSLFGLLAAAGVSWIFAYPRPRLSIAGLLLLASSCTIATLLAGLAAGRIGCTLTSAGASSRSRRIATHTAYLAAGFAPLSVLCHAGSPWSVLASAILAGAITLPLLVYQNDLAELESNHHAGSGDVILRPLNVQPFFREFSPALLAALLAELAALAILAEQLPLAMILAALFSAVLVWHFGKRVWRPEERARRSEASRVQKFVLLALAMFFTGLGLTPYLRSGGRLHFGAGSSGSGVYSRYLPNQEKIPPGELGGTGDSDGGYPGIILWPKKQQSIALMAPVPVNQTSAFDLAHPRQPLNIPFDGVYWYFHAPDSHPQKRAHVAHGNPADVTIRSTDGQALVVEAHQNLGGPINLACCREVEIEIRNADHYPGTVSVELLVRDTRLAGKPSRSLGTADISADRTAKLYDDRPPGNEVLNFPISGQSPVHRFDEFTVVFRLTPNRSLLAPRIGIEKFILLPKGT